MQSAGEEGEPGEHLAKREPGVESVGELGEVARQMLGAQVMVPAVQRALDVGQDRIDPGERRIPGAGRSPSGHERLVKTPGALHRGEVAQGVGHRTVPGSS